MPFVSLSKIFCLANQRKFNTFLKNSYMDFSDYKERKKMWFQYFQKTPFWEKKLGLETYFDDLSITNYDFYKQAINENLHSSCSPLTGEPLVYWAKTSGTSDKPKYFPYSQSYGRSYLISSSAYVYSIFASPEGRFISKLVVLNAPSSKQFTKAGIPMGYVSGYAREATSPMIGKLIQDVPTKIYQTETLFNQWIYYLAFLSNPDLIIAISPHKIEEVFNMIKDNFDLYKYYLKNNKIISSQFSAKVSRKRASFLLNLSQDDLNINTLWPRLKVISCWKSSICKSVAENLQEKFHGVVIDNMYTSTESHIAIPLWSEGMKKGGVLDMNDKMIEFCPIDVLPVKENLISPFELEEGRSYEVFVTNLMGLARYRLHDIVECTGFYNNLPILSFKEKTSNYIILGESYYSQQEFLSAVKSLKVPLQEIFLFAPNTDYKGLELYLGEKDYNNPILRDELKKFDEKFSKLSDSYRTDLSQNLIKPLVIRKINSNILGIIPNHFQSKIKIMHNKSVSELCL